MSLIVFTVSAQYPQYPQYWGKLTQIGPLRVIWAATSGDGDDWLAGYKPSVQVSPFAGFSVPSLSWSGVSIHIISIFPLIDWLG